jgi:hypothetical protein
MEKGKGPEVASGARPAATSEINPTPFGVMLSVMPSSAHHRLHAWTALLALLLATPLAAMPAPAMIPAVAPAGCTDCPMMAAAQGKMAHHDMAPMAGDCPDEPGDTVPNWDCCKVAPVPAVPLDEAAPTAPQTLAAPAVAAVTPVAPVRTTVPAVEADAPDPPGRGLYLLHSSYLN